MIQDVLESFVSEPHRRAKAILNHFQPEDTAAALSPQREFARRGQDKTGNRVRESDKRRDRGSWWGDELLRICGCVQIPYIAKM